MRQGILIMVLLFGLGGCADVPIPITTETIDATGKVVSRVTMEIADANLAKTVSLYNAQVQVEVQHTAQNKNAGYTSEVTGVKIEVVGDKTYITPLLKVTHRPVVAKASNLPDRIPDHWAKEVAIAWAKYGFYAFGVDKLGNVIGDLTAGAVRGFTVTGDGNVIQGNQNKAGANQDIRTDYVSCANGECGESGTLDSCLENPPAGYSEGGTPMYNETLSCGSYYGG